MKTYRVFLHGNEVRGVFVKAASHNAAEKKARKLYPNVEPHFVSVEYTEL